MGNEWVKITDGLPVSGRDVWVLWQSSPTKQIVLYDTMYRDVEGRWRWSKYDNHLIDRPDRVVAWKAFEMPEAPAWAKTG